MQTRRSFFAVLAALFIAPKKLTAAPIPEKVDVVPPAVNPPVIQEEVVFSHTWPNTYIMAVKNGGVVHVHLNGREAMDVRDGSRFQLGADGMLHSK